MPCLINLVLFPVQFCYVFFPFLCHFPLLSVSCLLGPFSWILYFALFPLFNPISLVSLHSSVTFCLLHLDPSPLSHCLLTVVPFFCCPLFLIRFHFFIFHCLPSDNSFLPLNRCPLSHFSFVTTSYWASGVGWWAFTHLGQWQCKCVKNVKKKSEPNFQLLDW